MNFFEQQDQARQNTRWLVGLFVLAVLCIVVTIYGAAVFTLAIASPSTASLSLWQPKLFWLVIVPTLVVIALGSIYKLMVLSQGGKVVAQDMGGRLLTRDTADPAESQLLNVVDEMAIAAGISVPAVYVMDREQGINAFAAGFTSNDAVIGVTRGTLEQLSRDELQGVIGHEFSHILNGDMRLNLHLVGVLNGILLLYMIGRVVGNWRDLGFLLGSSGGDRKNGGSIALAMALFGIALAILGAIGVFFGRVIKAAISRQREFLADASAVQFTRNPAGIAGALRKISNHHYSSLVQSPHAEENSHFFFGSALRFDFFGELFATHPPLEQRIRRLDAKVGEYAAQVSVPSSGIGSMTGDSPMIGFAGARQAQPSAGGRLKLNPDQVVAQVGTVSPEHYAFAQALVMQLAEPLQQAVRDPQGAIAVVYSLLLDPQNSQVRTKQVDWLRQVESPELITQTLALVAHADLLEANVRLPLLDLAVPTLRQQPVSQCQRLFKCIHGLAKADGRWSLSEFTVYTVLWHRLQPVLNPKLNKTVQFTTPAQIWDDCLLLLSALAQVGQKGQDAISYAFRSGAYRLPGVSQQPLPEVPPTCNFQQLQKSLEHLGLASPKLKQSIVDACAHTALLDNTVTAQEAELMRAIAIALDCPLPPFLMSGNRRGKSPKTP